MGMSKKGLEPTITTVLLVLITLIIIAIVAVFVFPFIKNSLNDGGCSEAINSISLDDSDYTCITSSANATFTGFSIKADNSNIQGFLVSLYHAGTAIPVTISQNAKYPNVRMLDKAFNEELEVKNDGATRTYVALGGYERLDVFPIVSSGKTCENARSFIDVKQCLDPLIRNQIGSHGSNGNATCGNGAVESGEQCDGNVQACTIGGYSGTQSCSSSCSWNSCTPTQSCGDGVCNGLETNATCAQDCHAVVCGNGLVEGGEDCDLGILNNVHGACTTQCTDAACGDGFVWNMSGGTEECDAGAANSNNPNSCRQTCMLPRCGDFVCDTAYGETTSTCSQDCASTINSCQITGAYWEVSSAVEGQQVNLHVNGNNCNGKSVTLRVKEDDVLGGGFDDDVIVNPNNAVFANGSIIAHWQAEWQSDWPVNPPEYYFIVTEVTNSSNTLKSPSNSELVVSRASPACGDGILDAGEQCDDGNIFNRDGCSSTCSIENGYTCANEPSVCACGSGDSDGDGICNSVDNCPATLNSGQQDSDGDGLGNACDTCPNDAQNDADGDGICGNLDNCPSVSNSNQTDSNSNGVGDACETAICGNGIGEIGEACDGMSMSSGFLCTNYTHVPPYNGGNVFCKPGCSVDFANCGWCGNGLVASPEQCELGDTRNCTIGGGTGGGATGNAVGGGVGGSGSSSGHQTCNSSCMWGTCS
jgi:cysteine-rich repeat protein